MDDRSIVEIGCAKKLIVCRMENNSCGWPDL